MPGARTGATGPKSESQQSESQQSESQQSESQQSGSQQSGSQQSGSQQSGSQQSGSQQPSLTLEAAGEAPHAPTLPIPAESPGPFGRITVANPPDRVSRALGGLDKRLSDGTAQIDDAIMRTSLGLDTARLAADPVLRYLRNARTFLPMARKAGLTARAAMLGSDPDFASAEKAVKEQQAWLSKASYLLREAFRLVAPANPLRLAIAQLDAQCRASCRDSESLLADLKRAASRAG